MSDAAKVVALALDLARDAAQDWSLLPRYAEFDALAGQEKLEVVGILAKVCGLMIKEFATADRRSIEEIVRDFSTDVRMQLFEEIYTWNPCPSWTRADRR